MDEEKKEGIRQKGKPKRSFNTVKRKRFAGDDAYEIYEGGGRGDVQFYAKRDPSIPKLASGEVMLGFTSLVKCTGRLHKTELLDFGLNN